MTTTIEEEAIHAMTGFFSLADIPSERITPTATRKLITGSKMMMVHWFMEKGTDSAGHQHPHEQFVWVMSGLMRLRVGTEWREMKAGDMAMIPGGVEHEAKVIEDTEVVDFFAPPRVDFLEGGTPIYLRQK